MSDDIDTFVREMESKDVGWDPTDPDAPLEAMLRRMSQTAEKVFEEYGDIDVMWLVEAAGKGQRGMVTPLHANTPDEADGIKRMIHETVRRFFAEWGVTRFACAYEIWFAPLLAECRPSENPLRMEGVFIIAKDGRETLAAMRKIHRPQQGKPYLGKLEIKRPKPGERMPPYTDGLLPALQ
jgi:hypothetical protein